ncbi:hypothetical protein C1878_12735 [Gordonibacter sp. 28C]|nr:hypothetical protein C1878_12735 [Gordonibacter sp. 28C]
MLAVCVVALTLTSSVAPARAYANPFLNSSNISASGMPVSGVITLQFSNNVVGQRDQSTGDWGIWVFDHNVGCISIYDEYGSSVGFSAYHNFNGYQNDDSGFERQKIYVSYGPLQPGTVYTLSIAPGMRQAGNPSVNSGSGGSITFTTAGEKPVEEPPDPPPPPDPDPPPVTPDGGGGSGGMAGSDSTGGGLDQSGANGSGASTGTSPDATSEAVAAPEEAAVESSAKGGESRAAGLGGGVLYTIGAAGLDAGKATDEAPVEVPELTWRFVLTLGLIAVCLALLGAGKRAAAWRRHTAH